MKRENTGVTQSPVISPQRALRAQRSLHLQRDKKNFSDPCDLCGKTTSATTENKGTTRKRLRAFWRWFLLLDLALLLVGGGVKAVRAWRWQRVLQNDVAALRALLQDPNNSPWGPGAMPGSPAELLSLIHSDLRGFQTEFAFFIDIAPHLRWLPRYGADLAAAPALLTIALELSENGAQLAQALEPLLAPPEDAQPPTLETA